MKVKMKENKKGSPDGALVNDYKKGRTYDLPDKLANAFVGQGWATAVKPQKPPEEEPPETKIEEPDETKVIEPPETKEEAPPEPEKKDKK